MISAVRPLLLEALRSAAGEPISTGALARRIYGSADEADCCALRTAVYHLRRARPDLNIETVGAAPPNIGYRLARDEHDARPPAACSTLQRRLLANLRAAPGQRCSQAMLSNEARGRTASRRRVVMRRSLQKLQRRGVALTIESGPPPQWGWVVLTEGVGL
jgi:hypothetical protein